MTYKSESIHKEFISRKLSDEIKQYDSFDNIFEMNGLGFHDLTLNKMKSRQKKFFLKPVVLHTPEAPKEPEGKASRTSSKKRGSTTQEVVPSLSNQELIDAMSV